MLLKLFIYLRTLILSTTTFFLVIMLTLLANLGIPLWPVALIAAIIYLVLLVKEIQKVKEDKKKRHTRAVTRKDIFHLIVFLLVIPLTILLYQHFTYNQCITIGYCFR